MVTQALISKRVFLQGEIRPAVLMIRDGLISAICESVPAEYTGQVQDYGNRLVMPGLVDTHVHINEPGRTEWEGFATATEAAAAGGITTVVDMPLNCSPVTTTVTALQTKLGILEKKLSVDCAFWGGSVPETLADLPALSQAGIIGVKAFLIDSGIDEFQPLSWEQVEVALPIMGKAGLPFLFHAEWSGAEEAPEAFSDYQGFVRSRPNAWEDRAIERLIDAAERHSAWVHIVHLSSATALPAIRKAKQAGVKITVETCPHYLCLDSDSIDEEHNTSLGLFKCCPPIRTKDNQQLLWEALRDGTIDFVVSDHSPCTPALKNLANGDFAGAWGGVASLQLGLSLIWTAAEQRGLSLGEVVPLLTSGPAALLPQGFNKGKICLGSPADLVVWEPETEFVVSENMLKQRHKTGPYMGHRLRGVVVETILRGETIFKDGNVVSGRGHALLLGEKG